MKDKPWILLIEPDYLQVPWAKMNLLRVFPGVLIKVCKNEQMFVKNIDRYLKKPPILVVSEVFFRWKECDGLNSLNDSQNPWLAGFRCRRILTEKAPKIPFVFYTLLDKPDLEKYLKEFYQNTFCFEKTINPKVFDKIADTVKDLVSIS